MTFAWSAFVGVLTLAYFGRGLPAVTALVAAVSLILLAAAALRNEPLRRWVRRKLFGERESDFRQFSYNITCLLRDHRPAVAADVGLTIVRLLVQAGAVSLGFRSFHTEVGLFPAMGVIAAVQLIGWIPITISGLGLVQASDSPPAHAEGPRCVLFSARQVGTRGR